VPRHDTTELTVKNCHRLNGTRNVGLTSTRDSPVFLVSTSFSLMLRASVTYSLFRPK
jgi:hypothetical protein